MTQSILMYRRQYHDRKGTKYDLEYYLLIDQVVFGCNSLDIYGARIEHYSGGELLAQRTIRGITPFGPQITTVINRLADGLILPGAMERMVFNGETLARR